MECLLWFVWFNAQNKTQEKVDKLWRYYKKFKDNLGVMHWKIDGFSNVASDGQSGATDAELDAATALILAYRQWGNQKYLVDVRELLGAIWQTEVNQDGYLKPGDIWDERKNPSYFNIGAMELFKTVDTNNWSMVIKNSFDLLKKVCDSTTGLPPDWCSQDGQYVFGGVGWEAVRVPWRMASTTLKDLCWYYYTLSDFNICNQ
jgi:endo-1,4-beta-D-glucanase Y